MNMEILSKAQADTLFHRESVLLGTADTIPEDRARELFDDEAVNNAVDWHNAGVYWNVYTRCGIKYLTYKGFLAAVSYHNALLLNKRAEKRNAVPVLAHQDGEVEQV